MLTKIVSIKNVGRFENYGVNNDMQLRRYNLFYAPNGRGKTTLCAILRSFQTGQPEFIIGRRTLGSSASPEVKLLCNSSDMGVFDGEKWNTALQAITIFDSTFVTDNVHVGDHIDLPQKRNLYRVIIGAQGVVLAAAVDKLDEQIRTQNSVITAKRNAVQQVMPRSVQTVEAFLDLKLTPGVDTKIATKEQELKAARRATQIKERSGLVEVQIPALPSNLGIVLHKTIEGIGTEAERRVAMQIETHQMRERGEEWLGEGLGYIHSDLCPFCGNGVSENILIAAYRAFFGQAYAGLKQEIATVEQDLKNDFGPVSVGDIEKTIIQNAATVEFWAEFLSIQIPLIAFEADIKKPLLALGRDAVRLTTKKAASPLEFVSSDDTFMKAKQAFAEADAKLKAYNAAAAAANGAIQQKKSQTIALNEKTIEAELNDLKAVKNRYSPETIVLCTALQEAGAAKKALEEQKAAAKDKLDAHSDTIIGKYENRINGLLKAFNAGFSIANIKRVYPGGTPSSTYQIIINGAPVELGDSGTPVNTPCFKNTLSAGDKSTLAFAFFLAQFEQDASRAERLVIFDDPFNSQDRSRRTLTKDLIRKCGQECKQVIVFSHDPYFLKHLSDSLPPADKKCLQLSRVGATNTAIEAWDIENETKEGYFQDHADLTFYLQQGSKELRDNARKIRPVLEGYCRYRFPGQFDDCGWLADMIEKIRTKGTVHQLYSLVNEVESIKDFSKKYHHDISGPKADTEFIDDGELQGFVIRTLAIVGGY